MKKWLLKSVDNNAVNTLITTGKLPALIAKLLCASGITSIDAANEFFKGAEISDPMKILGMDKATEVISEAIENGDKITIFGDYDCDGVTATVMLYSHLDAIGAEVDYVLPTRDEGYGLSKAAVEKIANSGTSLIITVDNGVSAVEEAEYIYALGMKLVVTDHHTPPAILPRAEAIVNPHIPQEESIFTDFAGCGVALKLIMALEGDIEGVLEQYSPLAAIGTIGDIMPLYGENRTIVRRGISEMQYSESVGLLSLIDKVGRNPEAITSQEIAFNICPKINSAGRYSDPRYAAELLLCQTEAEALLHTEQLFSFNDTRKQSEKNILNEAYAYLSTHRKAQNSRVLIVSGENWAHGIIGLVSAALLEVYEKPCIVIGIENGEARGSARSIDGFSIYSALDYCSEVLIRFGGHTKAAGFSLLPENIGRFTELMEEYAAKNFPEMPPMTIEANLQPDIEDLSVDSVEKLKYLEPFGEGNPVPLFRLENCKLLSKRSLKDGKYTAFNIEYRGQAFKVISFDYTFERFAYSVGDTVDLLAYVGINEYNNTKSVEFRLKDIRYSAFDQDKYLAAKSVYEKIVNGDKVDGKLYKRITPAPDNMKIPFDLIKRYNSISHAAMKAQINGVNYCLFMMCLHIFAEFGHLKLDKARDRMEFIQGGRRIETEKSAVINQIKKSCNI